MAGDQPETDDLLSRLIKLPAAVRRLYPRGGFEGLEANALQVLLAVHAGSNRTISEIAEELELDRSTVSHATQELRRRKLVKDDADPEDARRRRQEITNKGKALVERFLKSVRDLAVDP